MSYKYFNYLLICLYLSINGLFVVCENINISFITDEEKREADQLSHDDIALMEDEPLDLFTQNFYEGDIKIPSNIKEKNVSLENSNKLIIN